MPQRSRNLTQIHNPVVQHAPFRAASRSTLLLPEGSSLPANLSKSEKKEDLIMRRRNRKKYIYIVFTCLKIKTIYCMIPFI